VRDAENAGKPFMSIEQAVHRLTGELADWYHLDAGHLRMGDRADFVIVDPAHLDDSLDSYTEAKVEQYGGLSRIVNRNDDAVAAVFVAGCAVFFNGQPTEVLGSQRTGSFLRANTRTTAPTTAAAEPVSAAT
jgi:N-acyl-D-aspartate/D-glutamate deacylase